VLQPGQFVPLVVEKPAVGGSMIARVEGQVVLVTGAIPGERVLARIDEVGKGVAYATTMSVEEPSPDRRDTFADPRCGGTLYAHVAYERQCALKAQVVADALSRIGRIGLAAAVQVRPSPESGYRMRARLHGRNGRWGFFREGTHDICDARATRQLSSETADVLDRLGAGLRSLGIDAIRGLDVSENVEASQRAVHLSAGSAVAAGTLSALAKTEGLTGLTLDCQPNAAARQAASGALPRVVGGDPFITDRLSIEGQPLILRRHVLAFFQGNRFLLSDLVTHVAKLATPGGQAIDLYAGIGVFALAAAIVRGTRVVAVEGDRVAARDLEAHARTSQGAMEAVCLPVELFVARTRTKPDTIILDPPRTGVSRAALDGAIGLRASRVVYVSCDVATLARDARRLVESGYEVRAIDAFDLFPNTPHVETVAVFDLPSRT
jgi:23S rRNA (uracil1939-C5)-methyltransferase